MNDSNRRRRYFVAEDAEALALRDKVLAELTAHNARSDNLKLKYKADGLMTYNGLPKGLLYLDATMQPEGTKSGALHSHEGKRYFEFLPIRNRKAGKDLLKDMNEVGRFSPSDLILTHYKAETLVYGGSSMWCSTATIRKGVLVLQVPEDDQNPFTPHASFREIKKSEYIALTEE